MKLNVNYLIIATGICLWSDKGSGNIFYLRLQNLQNRLKK
jgi:hypothetical protein